MTGIALTPKPDGYIQAELAKFNVSNATIAEMRENFLTIKVADFNDRENAKLARERRLEVKALRVSVEKTRKGLKADALKFTQAIDGEARRITGLLEPIEAHLQEQEDIVTRYKERQEAEERARIAAEQEAERKRLEEDRAKLEAEKAEIERQKAEIEVAKQREADIAAAAEQARVETENRLKREAENARLQQEADEEKARRIEASRPDREKFAALAQQLIDLPLPTVKSEAANDLRRAIKTRIFELAEYINQQSLTL